MQGLEILEHGQTEMQQRYSSWYPARQTRFRRVIGLMAEQAPMQFEAFRLVLWFGYDHASAANVLQRQTHLISLARWRSEHFLDRHLSYWRDNG